MFRCPTIVADVNTNISYQSECDPIVDNNIAVVARDTIKIIGWSFLTIFKNPQLAIGLFKRQHEFALNAVPDEIQIAVQLLVYIRIRHVIPPEIIREIARHIRY